MLISYIMKARKNMIIAAIIEQTKPIRMIPVLTLFFDIPIYLEYTTELAKS